MILEHLFFWALLASMALVALNRAAEGLLSECQSCGRDRFRQTYCSHCGVIETPTHKNSESTT